MKKRVKKWSLRISVFLLIVIGTFVGVVLNPGLLYANQSQFGHFTIYHSSPLPAELPLLLEEVDEIVQESELYDSEWTVDICLNDGSYYPGLIRLVHSRGFAYGFYNKIVLTSEIDCARNQAVLNGYRWNLVQLLAHEMVHTLEFHKYGFWGSNPIAGHPNWKWEGYPEYISRQAADQTDLKSNFRRWQMDQSEADGDWGVEFEDGTMAPPEYYMDWMLVHYCMEVKGMSFEALLSDPTSRAEIQAEFEAWAQG